MKYLIWMLALALTLCVGVCKAEDAKVVSTEGNVVVTEQEIDSEEGVKNIDPDEEADRMGAMSPGQSYDENTGLPDVVESDSDMDLQ